MTASISTCTSAISAAAITRPIFDYEPPPLNSAVHAVPVRRLHAVPAPAPRPDIAPPRDALIFADTTLRRVLEVADRRRPSGQLRSLVAPALLDAIAVLARDGQPDGCAVLRRVRLRTAQHTAGRATAAELFATFTRGQRVRAAAGRIENTGGRWQLVALQLG
ncbi:hypothetical protein ABIA30_004076 [Mycobacterium sp. MAA66]|uniref:Rv3235 family protein n=1 Tax=Mycobacterium sp. MAA66 TaxID=3156297 RepID=UPI003512A06F